MTTTEPLIKRKKKVVETVGAATAAAEIVYKHAKMIAIANT
eukprot:CAMPEP_0118691546 /NCGR_PEP_ID=MMETSP0800-20121206/10742_1 /TAXON_ID=210618 ORGANISM="Striatella unipunctata, Strain CCMP2910" /NCGR_SAMPLE_ID=MMETSP0800 /ASSEMBLY_ACC=CAM_ASM_000638 /LENGTH=40 /DNA_ID= /DNA_START= /DNA_END= /DNA_ORIENTATION=